jgi:hypothetical protein
MAADSLKGSGQPIHRRAHLPLRAAQIKDQTAVRPKGWELGQNVQNRSDRRSQDNDISPRKTIGQIGRSPVNYPRLESGIN